MAVRTRLASREVTTTRLGAASTVIAPLLEGPVRPARVVGLLGTVLHVVADDPRVPLICVCTPEAIRLPPSLVLPGPLPEHLGHAAVGDGGVQLGETWIGVGRWWRPVRPRLTLDAATMARARTARRLIDPLEPAVAAAIPPFAAWLCGRRSPGAVSALVGRGSGLTPCGDDLLCGVLVALRAMKDPRGDRLAAAVARVVAVQTTHVSAALLVHATRGECIPELAAFVASLDGRGDLSATLPWLANVGHTSGPALAQGVLLAIATAPDGPG